MHAKFAEEPPCHNQSFIATTIIPRLFGCLRGTAVLGTNLVLMYMHAWSLSNCRHSNMVAQRLTLRLNRFYISPVVYQYYCDRKLDESLTVAIHV